MRVVRVLWDGEVSGHALQRSDGALSLLKLPLLLLLLLLSLGVLVDVFEVWWLRPQR